MRISDWSSDVCSSDLWSADGKSFYVQTNERDPAAFDLYRYATDGYERTLVFRNNDALAIAAVSPDGGKVAMVKPRTSADSDIYLLDTAAADAKPKLITPHDGNISHGVHEFTPDSGKLVYSTRSEEHTSELQSLMRNSYAVFCLKKKTHAKPQHR